jgi:hypothetical protein
MDEANEEPLSYQVGLTLDDLLKKTSVRLLAIFQAG